MKKRYFILLTLCMFLIVPQITNACWAYLTVDELVEKSDVILIGEIMGRTEQSIKTGDVNYNKWKVKVYYTVKGNVNNSEIIVGTPDERTSLHYDLNAQGNQVLLFLRKENNNYLPHSPQAVVGVELPQDKTAMENSITGEELLKLMKINNENMEEKEKIELEKYLSTREWIKTVELKGDNKTPQEPPIMTAGLTLGGAAALIFFFTRKK